MILSNGQAYFRVGLEAAIFVHEYDVWGFEGILEWEEDCAVINAFVKLGVLWTLNREMPRVEIVR